MDKFRLLPSSHACYWPTKWMSPASAPLFIPSVNPFPFCFPFRGVALNNTVNKSPSFPFRCLSLSNKWITPSCPLDFIAFTTPAHARLFFLSCVSKCHSRLSPPSCLRLLTPVPDVYCKKNTLHYTCLLAYVWQARSWVNSL